MLRLIIVEIIILGLQAVLYFGCETLQHGHKDVRTALDNRIPLIPGFSYIYLCWFPLIALFPLFIYTVSAKDYVVYQIGIAVSIIASTVIYMLFPTHMERQVPEDSPWHKLMRLIYHCDFKGSNCAPGLCCTQCFILMLTACIGRTMYSGDIVFTVVLCSAIVISAVMIKQHAVIDVVAAVPLAALSYAAGWYLVLQFGYESILRVFGLI